MYINFSDEFRTEGSTNLLSNLPATIIFIFKVGSYLRDHKKCLGPTDDPGSIGTRPSRPPGPSRPD